VTSSLGTGILIFQHPCCVATTISTIHEMFVMYRSRTLKDGGVSGVTTQDLRLKCRPRAEHQDAVLDVGMRAATNNASARSYHHERTRALRCRLQDQDYKTISEPQDHLTQSYLNKQEPAPGTWVYFCALVVDIRYCLHHVDHI
jgi:hypothetical protein